MKQTILLGALSLISASALADESTGFYLGANFGASQYDISKSELDDIAIFAFESAGAIVIDGDSSLDDEGTHWSFVGGYRFSRYFAVEAGYIDLGEAAYRSDGIINPPGPITSASASMDMDFSADGPIVAAVGFLPLGTNFDLHGRAGVFFADSTIDLRAGSAGFSASDDLSASSQELFIGIGAAYNFTRNFGVTVDYTLFQDVGDEDETGETDVNAFSAGVTFRF